MHDTIEKLTQFFFGTDKNDRHQILMANDHHVTILKRGDDFYLFDSDWRSAIVFDDHKHPERHSYQHENMMLIEMNNITDLAEVVVRDLGHVLMFSVFFFEGYNLERERKEFYNIFFSYRVSNQNSNKKRFEQKWVLLMLPTTTATRNLM